MSTGFAIHPPYEVFYITSMLFNTKSAVDSLIHLSGILEQLATAPHQPRADLDDNEILNHLQNVILQAGAISKYCFPPGKGREARADTIKLACGVTDASPLKNRELRNSLEHFDERLDEYLADGITGYIFPQYVGPELHPGGVPGHIFRAYYVDIDMFELLGVRYMFGPIANEVMRVNRELRRCSAEGERLWARTPTDGLKSAIGLLQSYSAHARASLQD
jgi:hypothetical protein